MSGGVRALSRVRARATVRIRMPAPSELIHRTVLSVQALKEERWKGTAAAAMVSTVLTLTILFSRTERPSICAIAMFGLKLMLGYKTSPKDMCYTRAHVVYPVNVVAEQVT